MLDFDLGFTPDIVTVAYGSNDFTKCTKEEMTENAKEYYRLLREAYPNAKIFSVLPIWRIDCVKTYAMRFEEAIKIAREAALAVGAVPIEGLKIVPNMREFFADAKVLHPNELGFNFYANGMYSVVFLQELLKIDVIHYFTPNSVLQFLFVRNLFIFSAFNVQKWRTLTSLFCFMF